MDRTDSRAALMDRALGLAYFIHNDKETALRIVASAMMRLETTAAAQDKRFYYTPTGRLLSDRLKSNGFRNKITLNSLDLLQLLVFIESEPYEKLKEMGNGVPQVGEEDMIIHFIKHLVAITMKRNSFYVTLGICRLLHSYSTSETMDIYTVILQDPDRTKDDHYCRSRKGRLMQEMKQRFGELISAGRGPHGEERFRSMERPARYAGLVRECLNLFSPRRTLCPVPAGFDPTCDLLSDLSSERQPIDGDHRAEANRIHAILHPDCFTRLTRAMEFDCPESRLALPHFFASYKGSNGRHPPSDRRHPPQLKEKDRAVISRYLDEQAARRKAANARMFRIRVDGGEFGHLNLDLSDSVSIEVDKNATMIEVIASDELGELILATHLLDLEQADGQNRASVYSIILEGGQEISFRPEPAAGSSGESGIRVIDVRYRERARQTLLSHQLSQIKRWILKRVGSGGRKRDVLRAIFVCGVMLALAGGVLSYLRLTNPVPDQTSIPNSNDAATTKESPGPSVVQEAESGRPPLKVEPGIREQGAPSATASGSDARKNRRSESLRPLRGQGTPAPATEADIGSDSEPTRDPEVELNRTSLVKVRAVYVECKGEELMWKGVCEAFTSQIHASPRFQIADRENADAALKVDATMTRTRAAGPLKQGPVSQARLRVQLVNVGGEIIWQTTRRVNNGKPPSSVKEVAAGVLEELHDRIQELEKIR